MNFGPPRSSSFSGLIPVRFDGDVRGPLAGMGMWRGLQDFEHATICRAFGLDQASFWFDLPSTCRGVGSSSGAHKNRRGTIDGLVFWAGFKGGEEPVGKLRVCFESEKFWDSDPLSVSDFYNFSHS